MSQSVEARNPRRELIREELLTKAAEVFERRGYAQARLEDIALELDLKRSSLQYYFKTKVDILQALVERFAEEIAQEMERIAASGGGARERLSSLLSASILNRMDGGVRLRALDGVAAEMPTDVRTAFERARRGILNLYVRVIREGIEAGEFRPIDPGVAALAVLGIANWTSWWYRPDGRQKPEELAHALVDVAMSGLAQPVNSRSGRRTETEVIEAIEGDLSVLRRLASERTAGDQR